MRLDNYLKGKEKLTRSKIKALILAGAVKVNDKIIMKASYQIKEDDKVELLTTNKYVSRAGLKLEEAITYFQLDFKDKVILDVGSSTGGFTDCSLKHGAKIVYAYDVGTLQMDETLRKDERIVLKEQTNILKADPPNVDIALIDVSFTSTLPIMKHIKNKAKLFVILFKPQFEVGRINLKKGIVKEEKIALLKLQELKSALEEQKLTVVDFIKTALKGKKGNQEYLMLVKK
ncbi:MAG: TlyA family RNA methyltransferase [Acholeplasmatales bacterium]|jgi:23S rRNA (cytidine1920-2'-O)/16S rRNA (cytidine1409-2'-O)-methyltransferase|nr:TlyA family RNA methyltransferase [Acholeplasmataceae bacterium]MDY0115720.1 TlyA family RNA methyltransferase [Acholeplasmatales bacterium]MCK9234307.1 TlyA family RNA methyltransferase [Acholeplasmataceae bacterium]MCK9289748.1 TlyA family RNA methyltransferase [Acholeplasmataceae bacterium]MCK9428031.1 TlyA family RNA methyltransferase [Acholeplasmataceae bacterium]